MSPLRPRWALGEGLDRDVAALRFELLGLWASGSRIVLSLDERCRWPRAAGFLAYLAPTGAFLLLEEDGGRELHVPLPYVLSVRRPHFSEPGDGLASRRARVPIILEGQLALW